MRQVMWGGRPKGDGDITEPYQLRSDAGLE